MFFDYNFYVQGLLRKIFTFGREKTYSNFIRELKHFSALT